MPFFDAIRIGAAGAADTAYTIDRSLRFNDDDTAYLSRTPSSAGNRKKWTFSAWIKRANIDNTMRIFGGNGNASHIFFYSNEVYWDLAPEQSGSSAANIVAARKLRDPSAWFHLVCALDTDESTANNRMRMYINGNEITEFSSRSNPSSGYADNAINNNTLHTIGYRTSGQGNAGIQFDGYMAEINFIDGQQYDASYFGETNAETGQWNPRKYTGSYGTNGFYLNFSDNSGTTATTLGKDSSGNGNNFTPNNFAVSDAVKDSPTNNFCVFNLLSKDGGTTLSEGNLKISSSNYGNNTGTFFLTSGKWYWEGLGDGYVVAICGNAGQNFATSLSGSGSKSIGYWIGGQAYWDGGNSGTETSYSTTDIVAAALDMDNGTIKFYKNNTLIYDLTFGSGTVPDLSAGVFPVYNNGGVSSSRTVYFNFGVDSSFAGNKTAQGNTDGNGIGDFYYAPPSGYLAICSANLPDPTILLPNQHFNTVLYSGDGNSTKSITGVGFKPDWLWLKGRNTSYSNLLYDAVRGAGIEKGLNSNENRAEGSVVGDNSTYGYLNSFDSDGFSVTKGSDSTSYTNGGSSTYVAWNWNAGDTDGKTYTVTVVDSGGSKFRFDGFATNAVTLDLAEGGTYIFNMDDSSNASHPFSIGTAANGTVYTSGITYFLDGVSKTYSEYTSGFAAATTRRLHITVPASAPQLYYWCSAHSGMGGAINTNTTLGSSNFDGATQAVVKASPTAGFSIVSYTGTGDTSETYGHGLGVKPDCIIVKSRNIAGQDWVLYHKDLNGGSSPAERIIKLNTTAAEADVGDVWYDTEPTSSVFTVGDEAMVNYNSSSTYVAYCFSGVAGYSKFGKYTANGNADGTFVFLGFRPALVIFKNTSSTEAWSMFDNKRDPDNPVEKFLRPSATNADTSGSNDIDFLSNGFKARTSNNPNVGTNTYIYLAFAESPFKNARAR